MAIYAVIEQNEVVNTCVADESDVKPSNWVLIDHPYAGIGWGYVDGAFVDQRSRSEIDLNQLALQIRAQRDQLLQASDWTQIGDVPQALKDKWAPYRQALRDVPQQEGFPDNVQWPISPE